MTDTQNQPDPHIEALLRLWGAEEASRTVSTPQAPRVPPVGQIDLRRWLGRLAWAAAGVAVAIGLHGLARLGTKDGNPPSPGPRLVVAIQPEATTPSPARRPTSRPVDGARQEDPRLWRGETLDALEAMRKSLADAERRIAQVQDQRNQAMKQLDDLQKLQRAAAITQREHESQEKQIAALQAQAEELTKRTSEAQRRRQAEERRINDLESRLEALRRQRRAESRRLLEVYLVKSAVMESGLAGLQAAAKANRLLDRLAELRRAGTPADLRATLDQVEVVLTRLDLLDTNDVPAMVAFERMVAGSGLREKIDKTVEVQSIDHKLRVLLLEVDLILSGIAHVV